MKLKVLSLVILFALFCPAYSATLRVPGDYPSIQAAMINAAASDTVLVAPGTYYEHITWPNTHGIKLLSEYGPDTTIIDAAGALRCITIDYAMDSTTVISGFTICNGNMTNGAGISCVGTSPRIINNLIVNNSTGGGIWIDSGDPIITDNIISHNTGADGGGIYCKLFSNPRIANNIIEYNSATAGYGSGGGICTIDAQPIIESNTIRHNTAETGGGSYTFKTNATIKYNTITNNTAQTGDGIRLYQSDATINFNDIFDNGYGLSSGFMAGLINAKNNWWGDATGPYHATNPAGLGDTVSDYIDFTPWLTEPHGIKEQTLEVLNTASLSISPNPFTHKTDIRYQITDNNYTLVNSNATLCIYDASGRLVKNFGRLSVIGQQSSVKWDGIDDLNRRLGTGIYFLQFKGTGVNVIEKLLIVR